MDKKNEKSNLEMGCTQIFKKSQNLRKDFLDKMHNGEITRNYRTKMVMGLEFQRRQFWLLLGFLVMFFVSFTGTVIMWFTSAYDNAIFANLAIVNNSQSFEMWRKPSPKPLLKMYIFNYTNVPDFEQGNGEKLNVHELGPYVYEESLERVNVKFNGSTVTFQEQRSYKFIPELSVGRKQNDRVVVPNVPMLAAAAMNKHSNFLTRLAISSLLNGMNAKSFLTLPAHRFITGYEDNLYSLLRSVLKLQNQKPYENFGLIVGKKGVQEDLITMNTGIKDINKIAIINKFNGEDELDYWSTQDCNSLKQATDGTMFSPKKIREKRPVLIYIKDMCRTLPLSYQKEVTILNNKIPAYRYILPHNIFDTPEKLPSNQCYCNMDLGACPPQGVFNATPCAFGAPAFISFPYFSYGDEVLKEGVTGLRRNASFLETYADIHPTLGFVMAGRTRFQLNIQVVKSFGISQLNHFEDGLMLPVAWFEMSLEDKTLPDDMVGLIFQTTFTVKSIELCLKYGSLLNLLFSIVGLLLIFKNRWQKRERTSSMRPLQKKDSEQ